MTVPANRTAECSCDLCLQSGRHAEDVSSASSEYRRVSNREQPAQVTVPVRLVVAGDPLDESRTLGGDPAQRHAAVPGSNASAHGSTAVAVKAGGDFAVKTVLSRITLSMRDLSPENAALLLAVGLVLGIFPMYGIPTILCILASLVARVNFAHCKLSINSRGPCRLPCWPRSRGLARESSRRRTASPPRSRANWASPFCKPSRAGFVFASHSDYSCIFRYCAFCGVMETLTR